MPLPDLIEIVPLQQPVRAEIAVPGSKSITNRALLLAALGEGETKLRGALWSEDTQVMVDCLRDLGFMVNVETDPDETCNRTVTVYGQNGTMPRGGTESQPLELFVGNAGTAARFLAALVCLGEGVYRLSGVPRMHQRPQAALFGALRELGYRIDSRNDMLPALIHGGSARPGKCHVNIAESSQFASALLLCAGAGGWRVKVMDESAEESPYVAMTSRLIEAFPKEGGLFQIEPDASSGSYFWAAGYIDGAPVSEAFYDHPESAGPGIASIQTGVSVRHWPVSGWQIDQHFPEMLNRVRAFARGGKPIEEGEVSVISRACDLGDSIMTAVVLAPFAAGPVKFTDLGRLRLQECERVAALRAELTRCGARIAEEGDTLTVCPSRLHGAEIQTYNDHRMAMCFAIPGLKIPGIKLQNPGCVKKTFPNFFQKLAAAAPAGLGVEIRNARTGRKLGEQELFAD